MKRKEFIVGLAALTVMPPQKLMVRQDIRPENKHLDFAPCNCCGVKTFRYHQPTCPRAAVPPGEEQFYKNLQQRFIRLRTRTGKSIESLVVEPPYNGFRFVRVWLQGESKPYTWNQPC